MSALASPSPPRGEGEKERRPRLDAARGVALVAMAVYHACWDLTFVGLADFDLFENPLWLAARTAILSSFLLLAGIGLVLATERGLDRPRYFRRLGRLIAAAAAVSAASYAVFPDSPIFFGVLHHVAAASVVGLLFVRLPALVTLFTAVAAFAAGQRLGFPLFDSPWLRWIGLTSFAPDSNDFVPLLPWISGVLAGIALARLWPGVGRGVLPGGVVGRGLALAGRRSLAVYLIHQPILFGVVWLIAHSGLIAVEAPATRGFQSSCVASCAQTSTPAALCEERCRCVQSAITATGQWEAFLADRLDNPSRAQIGAAIQSCAAR
ncbi:heparan-alpha-glucosaminide N-acetyltransferase [Azospirillum sp.]|uniref:heparan-alpha-glucosaminide N-acetyltransferase n=1 Tax=Azospirillum sp. TaxID=34012 RepID=UPI0026023D6E|nr:heparan-alpha-glucosaminide N-acetyltransferase [Azospirillum sp.]